MQLPESLLLLATTDAAVGCARREVRRVVGAWELQDIADVVELVALELVCLALGRRPVGRLRYRDAARLWLVGLRFQRAPRGVVIATWDDDPRRPPVRQPGYADEGGLYWVPRLAAEWSWFYSAGGKVVWCEVSVLAVGAGKLPRRSPTYPLAEAATCTVDLATLERVRAGLRRL